MNPRNDLQDRRRLAELIRSNRSQVAERVTDDFLRRHPDWVERYGDRARRLGIEDAGYHQDFLAAAIESNELASFSEYTRWAARMLQARRIGTVFLIENLQQIGEEIRRLAPAEDHETIEVYVRAGVDAIANGGQDPGSEPSASGLVGLYVEAAIRGRRQVAINLILEAVRQGQTVGSIYKDVLQPAMYKIGSLWEMNEITVAQEHMATAITQYVIAQLYPHIDRPSVSRGRVLITGIEGEHHQVGANMVADVLELEGWDVRFLGSNTPADTVVAAALDHEADIVGISATMLFNLPKVGELIEKLRRASQGRDIRIIVGGAALRGAPEFYNDIGAHACALDLQSAVQAVNALKAGG